MKKNPYKFSIQEITLMGLLLAFYCVVELCFQYTIWKSNYIRVQILFWIINGILFNPFKSVFFSFLCDTTFQIINGSIGLWMLEYAIEPPLASLITWICWNFYHEKSKVTIYFSFFTILIALICVHSFFFVQLLNNNIKVEGFGKSIAPLVSYIFISFFSVATILFLFFCYFMFKKTKNWNYIKWMYIAAVIIIIVILLRWLWGPFAYYRYRLRINAGKENIDFASLYYLTLGGIVLKSCLTIPLATATLIPIIHVVNWYKTTNIDSNRFNYY